MLPRRRSCGRPSPLPPFRPCGGRLVVWLLALGFGLMAEVGGSAGPAERLARLQEQLEALRLQGEFLDLKVKDTRAHVRKLEAQIARQQEKIAALQAETAALASETARLEQQILDLGVALQEGRRRMAAIRQRFLARLVHLHKIRQGTLVTSIFSARDLNTFLNRFQMVRYLLQSDRQLLEALGAQAAQLAADARTLQARQSRQAELVELNRRKQEELTVEMNSLSAMLETLLLERRVFQARQEKLKQTRAALEQEIARVEAARARRPAEVEPAGGPEAAPDPAPSTGPPPPSQVPPASGSVAANPGRLPFRWPVRQVLPRGYEPTPPGHPPGLEIAIQGETEVLAAARGKVLFKGPLGQFGNLVILGHKQGFSTVYGNLDDVWVGLGQVVEAGEVIGRLLGTRQTRLHFEIRFAGRHEEPLPFLPRLP
ncbi:MAG: metalloendopeptidase [Candidatus Ozemobacter sibiricus]|uniref:Metalloendopeptidase n=1 Tax=Candidatus Ozemobacter sibiricus TaxID=2268124 RepID=A0A367ZSI3_9BACT|nr:MAG: metalloendopeptidase [Candidatus Ozemobacter sibiricus]